MAEPQFVLNRNEGVDTVHRSPTREECNADQIEGRQNVDPLTAASLIARGDAVPCQHCKPEPQG